MPSRLDRMRSFHVLAFPGEMFHGKIVRLGNEVEAESRTLEARIAVDNADGRLKAGMFADVEIVTTTLNGVVAIPDTAVQTDENREVVFVALDANRFQKRVVKLGQEQHGRAQVVEGLKPGDKRRHRRQLHPQIGDAERRTRGGIVMINAILNFSVRQRMLVILGALMLTGFGLLALKQIPIDAFPDVTNVQVQVLATAGGMSPPEVEKLVTRPIEIQMGGLPRLTEIRSVSKIGLCAITIVFEDGVDDYFARQLVSERLQACGKVCPRVWMWS